MLPDLSGFFDGVSIPGALALLAVGFLVGTAAHEYTVWLIVTIKAWYAGLHD